MADIDFAELKSLKENGCIGRAFKIVHSFISSTAKLNRRVVDFTKLAQAVEYLIVIFPEIARTPKYQPSLRKFVANLQMDLWTLYNAATHAELKAKHLDNQWIAGRRAWLLLDKFSNSKRFVRAYFHTLEFADYTQIRRLNFEFREEIINHSSIPGFGLRLSNELLQFMDCRYKPSSLDAKLTAETDFSKFDFTMPTRETFKELRAFVNSLKTVIFTFSPDVTTKTRKWRSHELLCMGRICQCLKKYLTPDSISTNENIDEADIQEIIYGFAQIAHNICQAVAALPEKDQNVWFALDGVLIPINQLISKMALAMAGFESSHCSENHKYPCFAVYSFYRLIQTVDKRKDIADVKRCTLVETALKNVRGSFVYLMAICRADDTFDTYQHWSLVDKTINELARIFEAYRLCSYRATNIMTIYNALNITVSGQRRCAKMETLMIKMFLNQLLSQPFERSSSASQATLFTMFNVKKRAEVQFVIILISLLTENGLPQLTESVHLLVATLVHFDGHKKLPEGDQDLLKLLLFQLREIFPNQTTKLAIMNSTNGADEDELTSVWRIISVWQKDLQASWTSRMAKKVSPPPRLDIQKLCAIRVREQFSKCSTAAQVSNYVNTFYIAALLMLVLGKRDAGNSLLKHLLKLLVDWYYPKRDAQIDILADLIANLALDLGSSMWVSYKHSILSCQPKFDEEVREIIKKAHACNLKPEYKRRVAFGHMMNQEGLPNNEKTWIGDDDSLTHDLKEISLSSASRWTEYHDKACGHLGSMITENHKCGLRYAIQLLVNILSINCDRSFFSTLFSTSAKSEGSLRLHKVGKEILSSLRSLEKTIWITAEHTEDLLIRGMSTEARQFSNELLCLSEIWGLQTCYILAKTFQIRALELEGQSRKWREEIPALLKVFEINDENPFMRQINPQAKTAAISLDPPRRSSSQIEDLDIGNIPVLPVTMIEEKSEIKIPAFTFKLPDLPKMSEMDLDITRNYVIALSTLLRVHPDPIRAVNVGLLLFKEVMVAGRQLSQWLLEIAFIVIYRVMETSKSSDAVDYIKNALKPILRTEKINQKTCRRLARFEVALIVYDRTFSKEPYLKAPVRSTRKTLPRVRINRDDGKSAPVMICTKRKIEVFNDGENNFATCSSNVSNLDSVFMSPSAHCARRTKSKARRAIKKSLVEEDRASETRAPEEPEEPPCFSPENNINGVCEDGPESVRLQQFDSRPNSPIDAEINRVFNCLDPAQPTAPSASDEAVLDQALSIARKCGDMETIRAILNLRIGEIIRREQAAQKNTIILSDCSNLADLHTDVAGIGALIDTEFGCQLRLSNNITSVSEKNNREALDMISSLNATNSFNRRCLKDTVLIVSLIPEVSKTLQCSYENCSLLVTRLLSNGESISVGFDGTALAREAFEMRETVDKISEELSREVTDPNQWWETRVKRNEYCHQLWTSRLPDILGPALCLFQFGKKITFPRDVPKPKNALRTIFLGHAVRAWAHLNAQAKNSVSGIVGMRKLDIDRLAKSHVHPEPAYMRSTSTYLVLGRLVQTLCFERMNICKGLRVSRMMSARHAEHILRNDPSDRLVDISDVLYVVDSQTNLAGSAETVGKFFQSVKEWDGYTSVAPPTNELIKKLNEKSLYIFAGHGSGSDCVGGWGRVVRKGISSTMHLIGCASGRLRDNGRTEPRGAVTKILDSGCKSILALLWSVTDRDIDRFTLRLYADWFSGVSNSSRERGPCISRFINESARACKLGAANAGACVNYGLIPYCLNVPENWDKGLPNKINYKI